MLTARFDVAVDTLLRRETGRVVVDIVHYVRRGSVVSIGVGAADQVTRTELRIHLERHFLLSSINLCSQRPRSTLLRTQH